MPDITITQPALPADLPENWTNSQYVSAGGTETGLSQQHGYNYLMKQVNDAQNAVNTLAGETQTELTTISESLEETNSTVEEIQSSVGDLEKGGYNATATREGTTVAITGPENADAVTFIAPADWTAGDTYTYNGIVLTLTDLNNEPVEDGWKQGAPIVFYITGGNRAFFKAGGGRYKPTDLPPLNPNFTMEITEGDSEDTVTVTADKLTISPTTDMLAGGQWEYGTEMSPAPGKGQNIKHWTREQLVTSDKPFDGLLLGDVTASDAVNETILWLPENSSGSVVLQPYIVLSTDYLGGVYVTAKNVNSAWQGQWGSSVVYSGSTVQSWCENTYLNSVLVKSVADQVMECSLPVSFGSVVDAKCWIPSCKELGITTAVQDSGETMPYFANNDRRVYGTGSYYWTRSTQATLNVYYITNAGVSDTQRSTNNAFYRPAFVLPKDFQIQQRPDGSYTVYNDYGLITLNDIQPSTSSEERSDTAVQLKSVPASTAGNKVIVKIKENGGTFDYIALRPNYDGVTSGYALMRDLCAGATAFNSGTPVGGATPYNNSTLDQAMQAYEDNFPDTVKSYLVDGDVFIGTSSNNVTLKRKIFAASEKELGFSHMSVYPEGTAFSYFNSDDSRKSDGRYWTRSRNMSTDDTGAMTIGEDGRESDYNQTNATVKIRPIILLSGDAYVEANDDGTYTFTGEDTSSPVVSFSFTVPHGTQPVVRQYTYNYEEHYQTMLEGGVLPALGDVEEPFVLPEFTGNHAIFGDETSGRIELYESGTLTLSPGTYDFFLVGGGSGASYSSGYESSTQVLHGGGGGGKTLTKKGVVIDHTNNFTVSIGAGGTNRGGNGSPTSIQNHDVSIAYSVDGGTGSTGELNTNKAASGGSGGSGGGSGHNQSSGVGGAGGSDGSNGGSGNRGTPGTGQGTTTRAFEESAGTLYAGGGGGGGMSTGGQGGAGGGGAGGRTSGTPGTANTGGGGGGNFWTHPGGTGGSGIIAIRWNNA